MTVPVFILAGQSNAANLSSEIQDSLDARYGAGNYELLRIYNAGAPLTRERDGLDWSNPNEMRANLVTSTINALNAADDRVFGGVLWVQGEGDTYFYGGANRYAETLETLIAEFRTEVNEALEGRETGIDAAPFSILELSDDAPAALSRIGWATLISEQRAVAANDPLVTTLDPDTVAQAAGINSDTMFRDHLHYAVDFQIALADALVQTLNSPAQYSDTQITVIQQEMNGTDDDDILNGSGIINGADGNDVITGGDQIDQLFGGNGNDLLDGGGRADMLRGGLGNDTLIGGDGPDDLRGGSGLDTASYQLALGRVSLDLRSAGTRGDASGDTFTSIENVIGSDFADYIYGNTADNLLEGGNGDDRLRGDAGQDILSGGAGDDELLGGAGQDRLDGGDGNDRLDGGIRADHLRGQEGEDQLWGGHDGDTLSGGSGDDMLYGGEARDFLYGGQDNDTLAGEAGSDRLYGQSGDDFLSGGAETDWLYGGIGADVFEFTIGSDQDIVRDFQNNVDTILINDDLWSGTMTVQGVIDEFAIRVGPDVVFDFGNGDILTVENTNFSALVNDIEFF